MQADGTLTHGHRPEVIPTSESGGPAKVTLYDGIYQIGSGALNADSSGAAAVNALVALAAEYRYAGDVAGFQRQRGPDSATLLSSTPRTATTATADQTNLSHRGVVLFLDVTAAPGGGETLTVEIQGKDPTSLKYVPLATFTAVSATGTTAYTFYPGAVETVAVAGHEVQGLVLPRSWRTRVVHSAAGSWTYSLGASLEV